MQRHQVFLILALSLISNSPAEAKTELRGTSPDAWAEIRTGIGGKEINSPVDTVKIAPAVPVPTPLTLTPDDALEGALYMDAFNILREENSCSRFFGGSTLAVLVLNQLTRQLRKAPLDNNQVGFKMSGLHINFSNLQIGASYRLFDKAIANSRGPIYNRIPRAPEIKTTVGRFQIHSREGRVMMLLHELGHLIPGKDGNWLLPNDGGNGSLSMRNTQKVVQHCEVQIRALRD